MLFPGFQTVRVRIDNTRPSGPAGPGATQAQIEANPPLTITGATLNGNPLPAVACGKFPVGAIITGTYEVHDPGLDVSEPALQRSVADGYAGGTSERRHAEPVEPIVPAASADHRRGGQWTLDTHGMDPCGYVIRLYATDRTNVNSTGNAYDMAYDVGFCLEPAR